MYVIKRGSKYVARSPIRGPSYVKDIREAQIYRTRALAQLNACDDEYITTIESELGR
jgi:hypothetical protein